MIPEEERRANASISWNAGRTRWGKPGFDNFMVGASWSHWGDFERKRHTHVYLGLWVLTIITPSRGGKTRLDLKVGQ